MEAPLPPVTRVQRVEYVWIARKEGEPRRFSSTDSFSPERVAFFHAEGYVVLLVPYFVPDAADLVAFLAASPRVQSPKEEACVREGMALPPLEQSQGDPTSAR